jgi:hypothetical protein
MDALLAHTGNVGYELEGYPATFAPVAAELDDRGLTLATSYWGCRQSLTESEIGRWMSLPDAGLTGRPEELEELAEVVAQHYLRRPGDMVYLPIGRTHGSPIVGKASRTYYSDFIVLAYDYPPARFADNYDGAKRMEMVLDAQMARSGPYVAVKPRYALPAAIGQRFVLNEQMIDIIQQGGHISMQISPYSMVWPFGTSGVSIVPRAGYTPPSPYNQGMPAITFNSVPPVYVMPSPFVGEPPSP